MDHKARAAERIDAVMDRLQDLSRWLYDHPETAYQEHASSARVADVLAEHGFDVERQAYGLETAFAARSGAGEHEIVVCAEYDALPGVGHACGHNIIAAAAVGAGIGLREAAEELGFRVTVLGTPAEESGGGKVDLVDAGAFAGASLAMMVHPSTRDVVDPKVLAIVELDVTFRGKAAHASAYPHLGVNALDAFVQAYVNISTLRQALLPTDKVHGIITDGGDAPNVIPETTRSFWYVRAGDDARLDEVLARVDACFGGAATATGCEVEVKEVGHRYSHLESDPVLTDLFAANSSLLDRPLARGADLAPERAGSTDMGNVSLVVPSIQPMLDIHSSPHVNHQRGFAAHTLTESGIRAIRDGAIGMAWTAIDVADRDLWTAVRVSRSPAEA